MFGGKENRVGASNDKFSGMGPGVYSVIFDDMVTGISDKTGRQYWIMKFINDQDVQFDHFIACEATEYKTEDKVYKALARQMESLHIYDTIGEHEKLESFVQKAIDVTYQLKGKTFEFTIKKWKMEDREGIWGEITGFLDIPNEAIQTMNAMGSTSPDSSVNENEKIPF